MTFHCVLQRNQNVVAKLCFATKAATMKLFSLLCNHAFKQSNTPKSTCRYLIMEYDCQGKLSITAKPLNIPECLKNYLAFEEEL
jgi:hypothetical protein